MLAPGHCASQAVAWLILLCGLFGGYKLVVLPVWSAYEASAISIQNSTTLLKHYRAVAEQREHIAARLAEREREASDGKGYLRGATDALAGAALQDYVRAVISEAGGDLLRTRVLPAKPVGETAGINRVAVELDLVIGVEGLKEVVFDLEIKEPYLFIDSMLINGKYDTARGREVLSLDVRLVVYGYARRKGR